MELHLHLSADRPPAQLAELTQDLQTTLSRQGSLEVQAATQDGKPGERAVEVGFLGELILTFIEVGAAAALLNCLRAYFQRERSVRFRLQRADGEQLEIEGNNLTRAEMGDTLEKLEQFVQSAEV